MTNDDNPGATNTSKPRTDDGGEILDPAILERQKARREAAKASKDGLSAVAVAMGWFRCAINGKPGFARLRAAGGNQYVANLDGEGRRQDLWHGSQIVRV